MKKIAGQNVVIVGATGLVGSALLEILLEDSEIKEVLSLVRKGTNLDHPKLNEKVIDFDRIHEYIEDIKGNAVFCCLGTTIKKAKSKENFKRVDYLYPLEIAKAARENLVPQFNIITAIGADPKSVFFYNKVKGEIEEALKFLHFDSLNIFRPSLLIGERNENRLGEKVGVNLSKIINPIMVGNLKKYRGIEAEDVARAMAQVYHTSIKGLNIFLSDEIYDIAHEKIPGK